MPGQLTRPRARCPTLARGSDRVVMRVSGPGSHGARDAAPADDHDGDQEAEQEDDAATVHDGTTLSAGVALRPAGPSAPRGWLPCRHAYRPRPRRLRQRHLHAATRRRPAGTWRRGGGHRPAGAQGRDRRSTPTASPPAWRSRTHRPRSSAVTRMAGVSRACWPPDPSRPSGGLVLLSYPLHRPGEPTGSRAPPTGRASRCRCCCCRASPTRSRASTCCGWP